MGWFWFIPTFHMPHSPASGPTHLTLTREEIDFAIGIGGGIVDVDVSLEWLPESDTDVVQPPAVRGIEDAESEGVAATVTEG
jgi:phosphatidylinositol-3,4,5-trisphosphate 3-phosphatase and dual-specificity protein phosphatase PTEN